MVCRGIGRLSRSYAIIRTVLSSTIRRGTLTVVDHRVNPRVFGVTEAGWSDVTIRFTDAKVPRDIALQPDLSAGEAYMDGRMVIEQGEIVDLTSLIYRNKPWKQGGTIDATSGWASGFAHGKRQGGAPQLGAQVKAQCRALL